MNTEPIDLLDQYGIDTSSKLAAYTSSDYLKNDAKYGSYDFAMFFHELGLKVDFDTRKEGELLVRYFLAAVASYIVDDSTVDFDQCIRIARGKTDQMMVTLGIPKGIPPALDEDGNKVPLKVRAIQVYKDHPGIDNAGLIKIFTEKLAMKRSSAVVYASLVQHKWKM